LKTKKKINGEIPLFDGEEAPFLGLSCHQKWRAGKIIELNVFSSKPRSIAGGYCKLNHNKLSFDQEIW